MSAAVTSSSPDLPGGQAELAMLLVDVPHLAALARREGALEHVRDPRLSPIVRALLEGADAGRNPTLDELLDLVEPAEQPRVHDLVFAGRYRTDDGAGPADPRGLLLDLIYRCREEALQHEVVEAERRRDAAKAVGDASGYTEFEQRRLALRREQQALRHGRAVLVPAATQSPD